MKTPTSPPGRLRLFSTATAVAAALVSPPMTARADTDKTAIIALEGYFDFVDANAGTILPEQIPAEDYRKFRMLAAGQSAKDHVSGAANIEWRKVFAQRTRLPRDKTILVYCSTSSFAARVAMALSMDGFETVRPLYGGHNEWKARGGMDAYARASTKG